MKTFKKVLKAFLLLALSLVVIVLITVGIMAYPFLTTKTKMLSSEERINSFPDQDYPITSKATIYWNENLIPFIEAESDEDAAFLMGAVHAHLRLGQMELFKMVAQGRLSEMAGPFVTQIDHALRILDIDKSVEGIVKHQDDETRRWVQSYTEGINWYMDHMKEPPREYRLFNIPVKKWTPEDVYRLARLASADLTWGVYIQTLLLTKNEGWEKTWEFFLEKGQRSIPSFTANNAEAVHQLFNHISKSGSNSMVVSGDKSFNGNALMANDPHLGIFAPNMWFLIGIKSPSFHSVGMQIPGIPFIALGRNPDIAWGGTNMRSISSHLIELTEEELKNARTYTDTIKRRFWFDKIITLRETDYGPVITDVPFLEHVKTPLAIQWLGHSETNELRSFLNASKARNFEEFREAFKGYAVSGQNLVYADNKGNIGQIAAYTQPVLQDPGQTLRLIKTAGNRVTGRIDSYDLPYSFNPDKGFIASANNLPFPAKIPIAFEYTGYNRMQRMNDIAKHSDSITIDMLTSLQTDVLSYESLAIKDLIIQKAGPEAGVFEKINPEYWKAFSNWDGNYDAAAKGPVAFETLMYFFTSSIIGENYPQEYMLDFFMNDDRWKVLLPELLKNESPESIRGRLAVAMKSGEKYFDSYENWGEMHRLVFGSTLVQLPLIGNQYQLADLGMSGSSETLLKTAHSFTPERHTISYGSNSRHISNMADMDENYFVLLGGQDGWIKSPHNYDQLELWQKREYIRMPLRIESVREEFDYYVVEIY